MAENSNAEARTILNEFVAGSSQRGVIHLTAVQARAVSAYVEELERERDAALDHDWVSRPAYEAALASAAAAEAERDEAVSLMEAKFCEQDKYFFIKAKEAEARAERAERLLAEAVNALKTASPSIKRYRRMGYGDDVYHYDLCVADDTVDAALKSIRETVMRRTMKDRVEFVSGKLDEIVCSGGAHLEYMGGDRWFLEFVHADGTSTALWFGSRSLRKPFWETREAGRAALEQEP